MPKILLLDIETAPAKVYVWGLWNQNVGLNQIIEPGRILCWGAKWLGESKFYYADERRGTEGMLSKVHALLSEADAVVTYNGDRFDLPKLSGAFVEAGLAPTPPLASLDLIKTVRKLGVQSNKLAFIAPYLGLGDKFDTGGMKLWIGCMDGDRAAWEKMKRYNEQDVRLLGKLYNVLKPYIKNHPRLFPKGDRPSCKACGGTHVQFRGDYYTKEVGYDRFVCTSCGTWDKQQKPSQKKVASRNNRNSNKS